jgi:hypothetical protein
MEFDPFSLSFHIAGERGRAKVHAPLLNTCQWQVAALCSYQNGLLRIVSGFITHAASEMHVTISSQRALTTGASG